MCTPVRERESMRTACKCEAGGRGESECAMYADLKRSLLSECHYTRIEPTASIRTANARFYTLIHKRMIVVQLPNYSAVSL